MSDSALLIEAARIKQRGHRRYAYAGKPLDNRDVQPRITIGMNHYPEASACADSASLVTCAFQIVNAAQWQADRVQAPIDGGGA